MSWEVCCCLWGIQQDRLTAQFPQGRNPVFLPWGLCVTHSLSHRQFSKCLWKRVPHAPTCPHGALSLHLLLISLFFPSFLTVFWYVNLFFLLLLPSYCAFASGLEAGDPCCEMQSAGALSTLVQYEKFVFRKEVRLLCFPFQNEVHFQRNQQLFCIQDTCLQCHLEALFCLRHSSKWSLLTREGLKLLEK